MLLQHLQFSSQVDVGLWSELASAKLHSMRLSDAPAEIWGSYSVPAPAARNRDPSSAPPPASAKFCVERESLNQSFRPPAGYVKAPGSVTVVNTMEDFKETDKKAFIDAVGQHIVGDIDSGKAVQNPALLTRWAMLVYSNLKNYSHTYWLAFPAICTPTAATLCSQPSQISEHMTKSQISQLHCGYAALDNPDDKGFFLVVAAKDGGDVKVLPLRSFEVIHVPRSFEFNQNP
jgi:ubiquitin-like modifier-activating enzyme ATG7